MKFIASIILCLAAATFAVSGQVPKEKTLLWQVTGNGVKQPSWLFGTIHIMCPDDVKMPAEVRTAFNTAKQLYLELDMDDPEMMKDMMLGMTMKDSAIDELMDAVTYDSLSKIFQDKVGMPLGMMKSMKPILLMSLVYPAILNCQPESWEKAFQAMAKERQIELEGLENVSDQLGVLDNIPYKVQADMLQKTMFNLDSCKLAFDKMLAIYKSKDINALYKITVADDDFGSYENSLLGERNKKWVPVIATQALKMPTFFAFGAGHLGGPDGIISLLRKNGFTVNPVFYK